MPVWHQALQAQRAAGQVALVGVIQEQHADRCRLFAQWKGFDWPLLHDPINQLGLRSVPLVVAIDEQGIVRHVQPSQADVAAFLETPSEPLTDPASQVAVPASAGPLARGDHQLLWEDRPSAAIEAYAGAVAQAPEDAAAHFRLGTAYRTRFDSPNRRPGDFKQAVTHWERALRLDPNQYIYRRRLQQYGPRMIKPYPFYTWIAEAREAITALGATPTPLVVEPSGAELALPAQRWQATTAESPDPEAQIQLDQQPRVMISTVAVPSTFGPAETTRIHLTLEPTAGTKWNLEAGPPLAWMELPAGWSAEQQQVSNPVNALGQPFEFELKAPADWQEPCEMSGFVLYHVCDEQTGQCLYLRQDWALPLRPISSPPPPQD